MPANNILCGFLPGIATMIVVTIGGASAATAAAPACSNVDVALAYWRPIKEDPESIDLTADSLAPTLVDCLASPNAELRDRIGYELFAHWLRGEKLTDVTRRALLRELQTNLQGNDADTVLSRSFSALILAELLRSDAINPFMTRGERADLLDATIVALEREKDFRGFDIELGWVHPIAHMSDILWRFALHPQTTRAEGGKILRGMRPKIAPTDESYHYNESDRLARVAATLLRRELVRPDTALQWLESFSRPQSMPGWPDAFQSVAGMAELHNTKLFLRALSDQLQEVEISDAARESLQQLVAAFSDLV